MMMHTVRKVSIDVSLDLNAAMSESFDDCNLGDKPRKIEIDRYYHGDWR